MYDRVVKHKPSVAPEDAPGVAIQFLKLVGVSISNSQKVREDRPVWTGKRLRIFHPGIQEHDPMERASHLVHEGAHFLCSTEDDRRFFEYRLGPSPDTNMLTRWRELPKGYGEPREDAQEFEEKASVLGIMVEFHLGLDACATLQIHNWFWLNSAFSPQRVETFNASQGRSFNETCAKLQKAGFLRPDFKPTILTQDSQRTSR